jgi:hypothetical protein
MIVTQEDYISGGPQVKHKVNRKLNRMGGDEAKVIGAAVL